MQGGSLCQLNSYSSRLVRRPRSAVNASFLPEEPLLQRMAFWEVMAGVRWDPVRPGSRRRPGVVVAVDSRAGEGYTSRAGAGHPSSSFPAVILVAGVVFSLRSNTPANVQGRQLAPRE